MKKFRKYFTRLHFSLLSLLVANFVCCVIFDFRLVSPFAFALKVMFYGSGALLFLFHLKQLRKISIYFSVFWISPILVAICFRTGGIVGAMVVSVYSFLFNLPDARCDSGDLLIYKSAGGALSQCCRYEVVKRHFLFESTIARFDLEHNICLNDEDVASDGNTVRISMKLKEWNEADGNYHAKDSILLIPVE